MDQALLSLFAGETGALLPGAAASPVPSTAPGGTPFTDLLRAAVAGAASMGDAQALLAQLIATTPPDEWPEALDALNASAPESADGDIQSVGKGSPGAGNILPGALLALLRARLGAVPVDAATAVATSTIPAPFQAAFVPLAAAAAAPIDETPLPGAMTDPASSAMTPDVEPEIDSFIREVLGSKDRPVREAAAPPAGSTTLRAEHNPLTSALSDLAKVLVPAGDARPVENALTAALRRDTGVPKTSAAESSPASSSSALSAFETTAAMLRPARAEFTIPQAPAQPGWAESFAERVAFAVTQQVQHAELRLNPPQLGHIELRISLTQDQASVTFSSPHVAVRDAIEAALPRLRDALAEAGLNLVNVDISDRSLAHDRRRLPFEQSSDDRATRSAEFDVIPEAPRILGLADGRRIDCFA